MYVHFADNWNNFGWFMYFSNGVMGSSSEDELFEIWTTSGSTGYVCEYQIKWFYYNAERWDRLRPLDQDTWSGVLLNAWLQTTWWIYTKCAMSGYAAAVSGCAEQEEETYDECIERVNVEFSADGNGYYWSVAQTYSWQEMNLILWVEYDTGYNTWDFHFIPIKEDSDLFPSFVRIQNRYPVGFVYDYNGWVGLAWCRFDSGLKGDSMKKLVAEAQSTGLSNIFKYNVGSGVLEYVGTAIWSWIIKCDGVTAEDSLVKIIVEWIMWLDDDWSWNATKFGAMGNSTDTKMQYFATKSVNNITMINHAKRRAELLCRWKWVGTIPSSNVPDILCLNFDSSSPIDASSPSLSGKTLIVKWWASVKVTPDKDKVYDIFVDGWDLLVNEATGTDRQKVIINKNGFISDTTFRLFKMRALVDYFGYSIGYMTGVILEDIEDHELRDYCDFNEDNEYGLADVNELISCMLIVDHRGCTLGDDVAIASVIKWNFIVDGYIKNANTDDGKLENKYFIYWKLTTRDDLSKLEDTFSRRCKLWRANNTWRDFCPGWTMNWKDFRTPYQNAALVIIDQDYDSPLLKS